MSSRLVARAAVALFALLTVARPAAAVPMNPVDGAGGFLVLVEGNATLNDNENEAATAIGGILTMNGDYRVANNSPGGFTAPGDTRPTGLLVGGMVNFAGSTGKVTVNQSAYVHVGNLSNGQQAVNGVTYVIPTGGSTASNPQIQLQTVQTTAVQAANLFDFTSAFSAYRDRSSSLGVCAATLQLRDQNGQGPWPGSGPATLQLVANQQNVLSVTAAQLNALQTLNINGTQPSASTPLLINVDTSAVGDAFAWTPGPLFNGGVARYILWNFPTATTIAITGGNTVEGTVYAPRATITDTNSGNIQGNVIALGLVHGANGGEIHDLPFSTLLDGCGTPVTTTTSSTSTTSTSATSTSSSTSTSTSTSSSSTSSTSTTSSTSSSTSTSTTSSTSTTATSSTSSTTVPPGATCDCAGYPFLANYEAKLNNDADVFGTVAVNSPAGRVRTGRNVRMADGTRMVANEVRLATAANVSRVEANRLDRGPGVVIRDSTGPAPALPLVANFCPIPPAVCAPGSDVDVQVGETMSLVPGVYGRLRVLSGARLELGAGAYTFCDAQTGRDGVIATSGSTVLSVTGTLRISTGSVLAPMPGSPMPAVYVGGRGYRVSQGATVRAVVSAPLAKATHGRDSRIEGCECAGRSKTDKHTTWVCIDQ